MSRLLKRQNTMAVIGAGVVGTALGKTFSQANFGVVFVDTNLLRIKQLTKAGYWATHGLATTLTEAAFSFICVPTPSRSKDGQFDGRAVKEVISNIFRFLRNLAPKQRRENFHTIVVKSTVLPEFMEQLPSLTKLKLGQDYGLVFNPEFLRTESAEDDVLYTQMIIGAKDPHSAKAVRSLYSRLGRRLGVKFRFLQTDFMTASLVKYKHNLWLAATMGYLMEFAKLCAVYGVNPDAVIRATPHHDPISWVRDDFLNYGFLDECLPKDSAALYQAAKLRGVLLTVLRSAIKVNKEIIRKRKTGYDLERFKLLNKIS